MPDKPARRRKFGLARRRPRPAIGSGELVRVVDALPTKGGRKAGLLAGVAGLGAVGTAAGRSAAKALRNR